MKKSVVILIALIYVVAIALVSFLGQEFKVFDQIIPVDRIELLNSTSKYLPVLNEDTGEMEDVPYFVIGPNAEGKRVFQIETHVYPDDASNKGVDYSYDTTNEFVTISESGLVEFSQGGTSVTVYLTPADGGDFVTSLIIVAK